MIGSVAESIARDRVIKGMQWIMEHAVALDLDLDRIDPDMINVLSGVDCPLAQASGRGWFAIGSAAVDAGLATPEDEEWPPGERLPHDSWARDHGFLPERSRAFRADAELLDAAWRAAILARREGLANGTAQ